MLEDDPFAAHLLLESSAPGPSGHTGLGQRGVRQKLRLVKSDIGGVDPAVAAVLAKTSPVAGGSSLSIGEIRAAYARSRKSLLGPLAPVRAISHISPPGQVPLTVFFPDGTAQEDLVPGLLFLHGGGWTLGGLETYEPFCRALCNAIRSAVIWVEYRLAPEAPFPAAVEDSWGAAHWLAENAACLGIDPERLAIGGDSAGGNLAAVTALAAQDGRIAFKPEYQLLLYPCLDLTASAPSHKRFATGYLLTADLYRWYRANYLPANTPLMDWRVSPFFSPSLTGLPATIVLTAGLDPLSDEGVLYANKLRLAGVRTITIQFPTMIHGFLTMGGAIPAAGVALDRIAAVVDGLGASAQAEWTASLS